MRRLLLRLSNILFRLLFRLRPKLIRLLLRLKMPGIEGVTARLRGFLFAVAGELAPLAGLLLAGDVEVAAEGLEASAEGGACPRWSTGLASLADLGPPLKFALPRPAAASARTG